jgi:hypothetical protein
MYVSSYLQRFGGLRSRVELPKWELSLVYPIKLDVADISFYLYNLGFGICIDVSLSGFTSTVRTPPRSR